MIYYSFFKRCMDLILSIIGTAFFVPCFILIALLIKIDSKGPVFFKQRRVGKNKKEFNILKFRTMRTDTPRNIPTHLLKDADKYITRVGGVLRKTSLDELPQIINILRGEMSMVGPRPALWNQYDLIEERDKLGVNITRPGLTGWAQVNGRDELSIFEKSQLDGYYATHYSFILDVKIILLTLRNVFNGDGILEGESGTVECEGSSENTMRLR